MGRSATVAIVGRPNVGKSTLFNRLVGRRQAIVHDLPGVTRDRITAFVELAEEHAVHLVDTGGLVPGGDDPHGLSSQVEIALQESDLLLLVVDGKEGLTTADEVLVDALRRLNKPCVLVVNKSDVARSQETVHEFARLGLHPTIVVSAEHGRGIGELVEAVVEHLPAVEAEPPLEGIRVAIVGRPNVGKSSLLNRIVGEERALVSERPGTTRDPIDSVVEHEGRRYVWVDTAGIRRRSRTADAPEALGVLMARRQIEEAEIVVLVVDAEKGVTTGDLTIAGFVWEMGRSAVVLVNKWDLMEPAARERLDDSYPRLEGLLANPHRRNVSAKTGRGLDKLYPAIEAAVTGHRHTVSTAELNEVCQEVVRRHKPPTHRGRPWKFYYATQVGEGGPPTFLLFANRKLPRNSSYRRYLENALRRRWALPGTPLRLVIKQREGKGKDG